MLDEKKRVDLNYYWLCLPLDSNPIMELGVSIRMMGCCAKADTSFVLLFRLPRRELVNTIVGSRRAPFGVCKDLQWFSY